MPAVSKAQQRFMGMVHAADKGETPASPEVAKVSADMKDSDAKDFASTKHDGLPDHVKEQLKSVVREVIREKNGMNEMSNNDVHFKHIMKLYDRGGSFTKKKVGAVVCKDPKATRKDVEEELLDADYRDIIEFEDELGLTEIREKYNSVKEDATELPPATIPAAVKAKLELAIEKIKDSKLSNNAKLQLLAQVIDAIGIDKSQLSNIASKIRSKMESVVTEEFKHVIHVDTPTQVVSKPVAAQIMALAKKGVRASEIGLEMGFVGNAKLAADTFQKVKNKIYFELDKRNESVNEGSHGMATKILQSVVNGDSSRAEGTKMSKELAQHYIDWIRTSPFGKKNGNLPLDMLVKASFNWGIERGLDSKLKGELSKLKSTIKESVNEVKYPTDLKVGSVILGQGFTMLKGIEGGKYYKVVSMDDTTATLSPSDKSGNTKGSSKVRHKLDSIEGGIKTAKRGDENGIVVIKESVNEEHDCGCNENHDCGCGGLHEHHINEDINADANGIAGLTASRANAVKDFIEKNNINSNKLYLSLKKGNLKDRMDFVTALVGKPGNPIQKKVIKQFTN
jgi:hypothetical protein